MKKVKVKKATMLKPTLKKLFLTVMNSLLKFPRTLFPSQKTHLSLFTTITMVSMSQLQLRSPQKPLYISTIADLKTTTHSQSPNLKLFLMVKLQDMRLISISTTNQLKASSMLTGPILNTLLITLIMSRLMDSTHIALSQLFTTNLRLLSTFKIKIQVHISM
jgi:hypothetical protein